MKQELITHYTQLLSFLGKALGPDYEIVLYDLENNHNSVVAICNGSISGLNIGDKIPDYLLNFLNDPEFIKQNFHFNLSGPLKNISILRTSIMIIRNLDDSLTGLLCVNFDDSRFLALHDHLLSVAHPLNFLKEHSFHTIHNIESYEIPRKDNISVMESSSTPTSNIENMMLNCYHDAIMELKLPAERLTATERLAIIRKLREYGLFKLKGSVPFVAKHLNCSTASIYRYLSDLKLTDRNNPKD